MREHDENGSDPRRGDGDAAGSETRAEGGARLHAANLEPGSRPRLTGRKKRTEAAPDVPKADVRSLNLSGEQRLLILDSWQRSGLSAELYAPLVGLKKHTLYAWKAAFEELGPAALEHHARGTRKGSRLGDTTQRVILMLKRAHPEWGCERLSDVVNERAKVVRCEH